MAAFKRLVAGARTPARITILTLLAASRPSKSYANVGRHFRPKGESSLVETEPKIPGDGIETPRRDFRKSTSARKLINRN